MINILNKLQKLENKDVLSYRDFSRLIRLRKLLKEVEA